MGRAGSGAGAQDWHMVGRSLQGLRGAGSCLVGAGTWGTCHIACVTSYVCALYIHTLVPHVTYSDPTAGEGHGADMGGRGDMGDAGGHGWHVASSRCPRPRRPPGGDSPRTAQGPVLGGSWRCRGRSQLRSGGTSAQPGPAAGLCPPAQRGLCAGPAPRHRHQHMTVVSGDTHRDSGAAPGALGGNGRQWGLLGSNGRPWGVLEGDGKYWEALGDALGHTGHTGR